MEDAAAHNVRHAEFSWNPTGTARDSGIAYPQALDAIVRAIHDARADHVAAGDAVAFIRAAHTIKGSCGNLGAERLRRTAERVEHGARKNGLVGLENAVAELEAEFATVRTALSALL